MIEIIAFRPFKKNTLQGFLTLRTGAGWQFADIAVHQKDGKRWLSMPAREFKKQDGETSWTPVVKMTDPAKWETFQTEALKALDAYQSAKPEKQEEEY
jgi:hypothetical protein